MKKIIMSVIALAIALALVVAIWVPLAGKSKDSAHVNYTRTQTIDTKVGEIANPLDTVITSED